MAKALDSGTLTTPVAQSYSLRAVRTLRLALGYVILLGATIFFLGTSWDIQWHSYIGRDRTLIPPHIMMLSGILIAGVAALSCVLIETLWARRDARVADSSTQFADAFRGSLGAYIAGYGALSAAIGFPLDAYWHSLYGIDVQIWAPFHVMIIASMAAVALGAAYTLTSAANLSARESARAAQRWSNIGVLISFAIMLSVLTFLLFDAYGDMGTLPLGPVTINVFAALAALFGLYIFVAASAALPWRWAATGVTLVSLIFVGIDTLYIPKATTILLQIEQQTYRRAGAHPVVVAVDWPLLFLVGAIIFDLIMRRAQKRGWSVNKLLPILAISTLIGFLPAPILFPLYPAYLVIQFGVVSFILTLLIGFAGGYVGAWLGQRTGNVIHELEQ